MNKRKLHHFWRAFRHVKPVYFLGLALLSGIICVFALRANNEHMAHLRQAVYDADKNNTNVQQALNNLQAYVTAHMNTDLSTGNTAVYPPIQLQYTYERLLESQGNQLQAANGSLYTDAEHYCQQQIPTGFSGRYRISCVTQYVQNHGVKLPAVSPSLYEFDFISPWWSPDLAGWSLLATIGLALLAVVDFLLQRRLRKAVR